MLTCHHVPRCCLRLQGAQSRARGGPFATLNGAAAGDVLVVHVPANLTVPGPIHVLYLSSGGGSAAAGSAPAAAPRLLAVLEEGSSADIVEEFAAIGGGGAPAGSQAAPAISYLTNAVAEFELDDRAQLKHSYVEVRGRGGGQGRRRRGWAGRWAGWQKACVGRSAGLCIRHTCNVAAHL